ncbi:MAG TPA: hypothetical protein VJ691_07445 [Vicinamibacterales bacterium]|nr:hypothetical protein [Vicinamibacterales bacterium]
MRTFVLTVVLLGVVSIAHMWPPPPRQIVGTITDIEPGGWIHIDSEMVNFSGLRIGLGKGTKIEGDPGALRRDVRVRVFYSSNGGDRVARRVTILPNEPRR